MNLYQQIKRQTRALRNQLSPQFNKLAQELGLLPTTRDYTRFIILGRSRSGSNLLRGLLNSHSQVITFEEMFKDPEKIGWGLEGYPVDSSTQARFKNETLDFIQQDLFQKMPAHIKAVGFKIFYYHAHDTSLAPVWGYLQADTSLHVLHIKRRNILKTHLSKKRAELTNSWINLTGEKQKPVSVELDIDECRQAFEQTRAWEDQYDHFFINHPSLEVIYEDLAAEHQAIMTEVQQFLGLDYEALEPQTYKQAHQKLEQAISNYDELKSAFDSGPWSEFFNE